MTAPTLFDPDRTTPPNLHRQRLPRHPVPPTNNESPPAPTTSNEANTAANDPDAA